MQQLIPQIAADIKSCAAHCDAYAKLGLVAKVIKGPSWDRKLSTFADTFAGRRAEIERVFAIHVAQHVDRLESRLACSVPVFKSIG